VNKGVYDTHPMLARAKRAAVFGLYGLISAIFCAPLFRRPNGLGISDWDQHLFYYGSVLKNIIEYGQLPFWNPWYCGGNVLWQNPQVALLSPTYPLALFMSLALAMKMNIFLHYWLGFIGMHLLLTRVLGLSYLPVVVYLVSLFTVAGGIALHLNAGHSVFLPAFYLPLLLFFYLRGLQTGKLRDIWLGGAVLALIVYNGGLHILPMAIVTVGVIAVVATVIRKQWQPLILVLLLLSAGFGYSAPKLLPVTLFVTGDQFWDARTVTPHPDWMSVPMLIRTYLDPYQHRSLKVDDVQRHGWYEYGNYMGSFGVIMTLASIIWIGATRRLADGWLGISFAVTAVLLLALSAGEFSPVAPASIAAHLPLFSSFRIPSRYTVAFALFAAVTSGFVARSLLAQTAESGRLFIGLVCAIATLQLVVQNRVQFNGVFSIAPLDRRFHVLARPDTPTIDRVTSAYGPDSPMLSALMEGKTFYNCYESLQLRHTADPDRPLIFNDGKSKLVQTEFSPNRIQFSAVAGSDSSEIFLNQNYARGWQSTAGQVTPDPHNGMPSVKLLPGQAGRFSFRFVPPGLILSLLPFFGAVVGSAVFWNKRLIVRG
jgi:hypothetical protein